jgi:hypothetical protein
VFHLKIGMILVLAVRCETAAGVLYFLAAGAIA